MKNTGISEGEFEKFVMDFRDHMYILAYSVLHNPVDAQDAVSESFLKIWENRNRLRDSSKLYAWASRIVLNTAKTMWRKNRRTVPMGEIPENARMPERVWVELWDCVTRLSDRERDAVLLYYYEGYKQSEIARMLDIPEGTLKSRLRRARNDMRKILFDEGLHPGWIKNVGHETEAPGI